MQASVQHYPTEDLNTADTSCPSRTSAEHFEDRPGPCPENERSHPCTNVAETAPWSTDRIEYNWLQRMHLLTDSLCTATLTLMHWTFAEHSVKLITLAEGATRLQACINAVKLAIIANSIALDTVLKAACTARVPYSSQWWCLEKNYWAVSECALNAVATAVLFHNRPCLTSCFTVYSFSPLSLRPGVVGVCFEVPEWILCLNGCSLWSWGSLLGIPGFRIEPCCFYHPLTWPLVWFCVFFVFLLVRRPFSMTHKMSPCKLFPLLVVIPLFVLFVCFGLFVVLCLLFAWFVCFWLCFLFGFLLGQLAGLRTVPLPVLLWLSTSWQLAWQLQFIILLRVNVCNDLAEAMKALEGKNTRGSKVYRRPMKVVYGRWGCWFEVQSNGNGFHGSLTFSWAINYQKN